MVAGWTDACGHSPRTLSDGSITSELPILINTVDGTSQALNAQRVGSGGSWQRLPN